MEEELEGRDGKAQFLYDYLNLDWFSFFLFLYRKGAEGRRGKKKREGREELELQTP